MVVLLHVSHFSVRCLTTIVPRLTNSQNKVALTIMGRGSGYPFQRRFLERGIKIVNHGFIFCLKLLLIMKKRLFDV